MHEQQLSPVKACVERRKNGNACTTLRVSQESSKKIFWCEVKATESTNHESIIHKIAEAVRNGVVPTKTEAQKMKADLLLGDIS